jgi:hypothetical protein
MAEKIVAALFDDIDKATKAVRRLHAADIEPNEISIIVSNRDGRHTEQVLRPGDKPEGDAARTDDGVPGAAVGAAIGAGAGFLAGLALLAIPGIGQVVGAGWIVALLTSMGVLAGVAGGSLADALAEAGLPLQEAEAYAEGVRRGGILVAVRTAEENADLVEKIFKEEGAVRLEDRVETWRSEGWTGEARTPA